VYDEKKLQAPGTKLIASDQMSDSGSTDGRASMKLSTKLATKLSGGSNAALGKSERIERYLCITGTKTKEDGPSGSMDSRSSK
jgi:hypothetical protein